MKSSFNNPPPEAKPMVRWWWFGAAVEKPEILRELQQMKADGIGGAELAFVYPEVVDDPAKGLKNLPFLSPAMLDAVHYAQAEGRRLGLRIDVTLCSGWPYGGPNTPLAEAAGRLRTAEVPVPANVKSISLPKFEQGESLISGSIALGEPKHWTADSAQPLQIPHDTTELVVEPSDKPRIALFFIASHTKQQVKRAAV
ncbi:MAG TPA: glycosyl hydrolase, partial [Edaphobacter sp.]|nr:glycosyl hydrolase [Edaphobacter sp.]